MIRRLETAETLPALGRDVSFWGMIATQFLGAFNDNLFKQLLLLLCVDLALRDATAADYQGRASVVFAAPFILFSGFAGFLSDRYSKRRTIVWCKIAEVAVMALGMIGFAFGDLGWLLVVLFLMGMQSAYFGPAKYGILPELLRERDLPRANGIMLMTTFLAIIFGFAVAGHVKAMFAGQLWISSLVCLSIAVVGVLTAQLVRETPIAHPGLAFQVSSLAVNRETRGIFRADRPLLSVLLISSCFWLVGGVVYPLAINALGKLQIFRLLDTPSADIQTGYLAACTGVGIAVGCIIAGRLSHNRIDSRLVRIGVWGMIGCLALLSLPNPFADAVPVGPRSTLLGIWGARIALVGVGLFAGFFTVPLQVFLQVRPPRDQKGRVIGAMNLVNWIGIALAGVLYSKASEILGIWRLPPCWMFAVAAIMLLPIALFYRPPDLDLT